MFGMPRSASKAKIRWSLLSACFLCVAMASFPAAVVADDKGQAKLDEATSLKLDANTPAKLARVIELCEEAIKEGLDADNTVVAKQFLSASALQKAKLMLQQLPRAARNANQLQRLKSELLADVQKAIDADPALAEAHLLAAQFHMIGKEDLMAAMGHANKAIEILKDSPVDQSGAYMLRARLQSETDDQLNDLRLAVEADPTNMQAWQMRIAMQISLGKLDDAYKDIQKLLESDQSSEFAIEAAFRTFLQLKKFDELIRLLDKQIAAKPKEASLYRMRGTVYIVKSAEKNDKELLKTALADLDKAIELNKRDADALISRSQVLFDLGEMDKARRDVSDALLINPEAITGIFMRAAIAAREQRYGDAISDMEMLVRAVPNNESYVRQLASYYQLDDRPRLAIRILDEVIKKNKNGWRNLRVRGDARLSVGEHNEAIRDYESALQIIERLNKEKKDGKTEEVAEADAELESDVAPPEEHAGLLNNLAWVLATSPKDDVRSGKRALEYAQQSCKLTEYKEAHILSTLAAAYAESGDFDKAREWSNKAVEIGAKEENEQLDQLKKELESYKENKPWREEQKTEENKKQRVKGDTIET